MVDPACPIQTTDDALEVHDLTKIFGTVRAVDGVSFRLPSGGTLGLLGGNGAGKTTTIGMIMGLVRPDGGTIRILGLDPRERRSSLLARMNFESPYVDMPHRLTVRQNLKVFARLYEVTDAKARIAELARDFALEAFLDRRAGQLSAGQKTRVALAKALINRPKLLLLDEPTASLDPDTADWIRSRLEDYRRETGAALLIASHNMAEVERLCDEVVILSAGRIATAGTPSELMRRFGRDGLEEVFLDVARGRGTAAERAEAEAGA